VPIRMTPSANSSRTSSRARSLHFEV
jgi:hypothetical protein